MLLKRFSDSLVFYSRPSLDDQLVNLDLVMQEQGCFETPKGSSLFCQFTLFFVVLILIELSP